jgi:hypothetical protein
MRGLVKLALLPAVAGLMAAAFLSPVLFSVPARAQEGPTLGIDAEPSDNTATTLGVRNVCIAVHKGDTFDVDITAENVNDLAAWEAYLALDASVVSVIDRTSAPSLLRRRQECLQASSQSPRTTKTMAATVSVARSSEPACRRQRLGVLARLTLQTAGSGVSDLSVKPIRQRWAVPSVPLTDVNASRMATAM